MTTETRWLMALHEAAHLAVALDLSPFATTCFAAVFDGGGLAHMPRGLHGFNHAVALAAGMTAARRLHREPIPERTPTDRPRPVEGVLDARHAVHEVSLPAHGTTGSDGEKLARYAVDLANNDANDAARRLRRVMAAARLAVWRNREHILALARELFLNGSVIVDGDPEHEAFFAGGAVAAGATKQTG